MFRLAYLSACLALAGIAGFIFYTQTEQASALVAERDLTIGERLTADDLAVRRVPASSLPDGVLTTVDQAVGQFLSFPLLAGQYVTPRHLSRDPSGSALTGGLPVPPGDRIVSLPLTPAAALGGALAPGDLVDVIAVPDPARSASAAALDLAGNSVLGQRVLVVGLRTDQGTALETGASNAQPSTARLGSVLVAIPDSDEQRYAAAIGSDTFVLTLVTG
jgi:pilus assembly protein CpaB